MLVGSQRKERDRDMRTTKGCSETKKEKGEMEKTEERELGDLRIKMKTKMRSRHQITYL